MTKKYVWAIGALCMAMCAGCGPRTSSSRDASPEAMAQAAAQSITVGYAQGFSVTPWGDGTLVTVRDPQGEHAREYRYALLPKGADAKDVPEGYTVIRTPIRSVACMTSLQLSGFIRLGEEERVVGITSTRHLFNAKMKQQLKEGKTQKIGIEGNFDAEVIMALNPEVILISPFKRGGYEVLTEVNIPLIPHLGYKEMTPLGQAEWIKFIGLLTGEAAKADSIFASIEQRYNELKQLTAGVTERPTVFSGEVHNGNWYAVGGQSFLAQLFRDAGADYFMKDNPSSGGVTLDFETAYAQACQADYWRLLNSFEGEYSYDAVRQTDARYADFKAFKERRIIYCNQRLKPYYESMPMEPEILLADFVKAFHPELLPDYQPKYYEILK